MRVSIVEDEPFLAEAIRDGLRLEAIASDIPHRHPTTDRTRGRRPWTEHLD
jgi:hypothetical protein